MSEARLTLPQKRILRSIVFAGALTDKADLVGYQTEDLGEDLRLLEEAGFVENDGVIVATENGSRAIEEWYAQDRLALSGVDRDSILAEFRPLDLELKRLATRWQDADERDDWDARLAVIESFSELHENTIAFIKKHWDVLPRFEEFGTRLSEALQKILDGETQYVVSVSHPSYHTVWFQFHEDLLRTLERRRDPE